jgi:hypothetical protein
MEYVGWLLILILFAVGMAGAVIPVLPGALAIFAAFFVYGWFFSFAPFGFWFWFIQAMIVVVITLADYAVSALGVKKFGGTRASVIGSTIGLLLGPFVIPAAGLLIGPFIGAVAGELLTGMPANQAMKAGLGAVVGIFSSVVVKIVLQSLMIVLFLVWI